MLKIALVTNHPPPFRIPVYEKIAGLSWVDLHIVFCSPREPNRQWETPPLHFQHSFLKERFVTRGDNFIHNNPDVVPLLHTLSPDVVVTTGFNPTYLYAFLHAAVRGIAHVPMTDGTDVSERALSSGHRLLRRMVYGRSQAFLAASLGGMRLYRSYGIPAPRCFQSCLCTDNGMYLREPKPAAKDYDFIFCGRIVPAKNPAFALDVAHRVAKRLGRTVRMLFVGDGQQEQEMKAQADGCGGLVRAEFHGHAAQHELPALYRSARIFLFPTLQDVWGVVANEACAAGLPVIVSPHAGVAGELVQDGQNGFICDLDADLWSARAAFLLTDSRACEAFSLRSQALVAHYTFDHAAAGVVEACRYAAEEASGRKMKTWSNRIDG